MCGISDYGSLLLMAERMLVFGIAVGGGIVTYRMLCSVREKHYSRLGRSIEKLMTYLRLR